MKYFILITLLGAFLPACNNAQQMDRQAVLEEMKERELKHVLPGEIMEAAYVQGDSTAQAVQSHIIQQYQASGSPLSLSEFLQQYVKSGLDSLEKEYEAKIQWIAATDTASSQLTDLEQQILQAYLYNIENNLEVSHNVQRVDDESYLYTKPVTLNALQQKPTSLQQAPADTSQFLGMWSIRLSKREIILNM